MAPASAIVSVIASAITQRDVDAALDALGPFEAAPALAVAVSGGADSLAAALLCHAWARARGGTATALIVDHGLRPESADEAARARALLTGQGMSATILALGDTGGNRNLQAAARAGRYDALARWCRANDVLHLVTGHHRGDQAETVLLRLMRGSGVDGLSAMPAVQPAPGCRILRPLLGVDPERLRAYLQDKGVDWIEDPSNRDTRFRRVQVRGVLTRLAEGARLADGADLAARAAEAAAGSGRARRALEAAADTLAVAAVRLAPEGYAILDPAALAAAPEDAGLRVLARTVRCVGGLDQAPRFARLRAVYVALRIDRLGQGRTLGGCRIAPAGNGRGVLVCREAGRARTQPFARRSAEWNTMVWDTMIWDTMVWDGRFAIRPAATVPDETTSGDAMMIGPLGQDGWTQCVAAAPWLRATHIPHAARLALPALRRGAAVIAVPALGFVAATPDAPAPGPVSAAFRPRRPLCPARFRPLDPAPGAALATVR